MARGLVHFFGAHSFATSSSQGQNIYSIFTVGYTSMLAYDWWLPYLIGIISPSRLSKYQNATRNAMRILPSLGQDRPVPTVEQTCIFFFAVNICIRCWVHCRGSCKLNEFWVLATFWNCAIPLGMMSTLNWDASNPDVVGLGIAVSVTFLHAIVILYRENVEFLLSNFEASKKLLIDNLLQVVNKRSFLSQLSEPVKPDPCNNAKQQCIGNKLKATEVIEQRVLVLPSQVNLKTPQIVDVNYNPWSGVEHPLLSNYRSSSEELPRTPESSGERRSPTLLAVYRY